jgi:rhodanese-related sulfurtransferase
MIRYLLWVLCITGAFLISCSSGQSQSTGIPLPASDFAEKLKKSPDAMVIDVRTPEEFSKGHIPDAKNIDWNSTDFRMRIDSLDHSRPVFVYCLAGARSSSAAKQMRADGFSTVYELEGGILKWRAADLPEAYDVKGKSQGMSIAEFTHLTHSEKAVLTHFSADWCAPCKKMKPFLDEIASTMSDRISVIRINADDNQLICKELHVDALPVLQLYRNGEKVWNHTGFISKEELLKKL